MAIKITEDGNVIYENEPTVERELLPNITDGEQYAKQAEEALERIEEIAESIPEDYTQLIQDVATLEDSVSDLEEDVEELQNNYTPLSEDVTELKNDLNQFPNGTYPNMSVGNADQLTATVGIEDNAPYLFRTSGGSNDIGDREDVKKIVGGTVANNQLFPFESDSWSVADIAFSITNGKVTASGTANASGIKAIFPSRIYNTLNLIKGHVYFLYFSGDYNFEELRYVIYGTVNQSVSLAGKTSKVFKSTVDNCTDSEYVITITSGTTYSATFDTFLVDITLDFGTSIADYVYSLETATAGAGVAWLKTHFPKQFDSGYQAYDAGSLQSVSGLTMHKMVGFNQWDEEVVHGYYDANGVFYSNSGFVASKNKIRVVPNTVYNIHSGSGYIGRIVWLDSSDNAVGSSNNGTSATDWLATSPANANYLLFNMANNYGGTYNHDICINFHWDGEKDGTYEPYKTWSYALDDSVTLRGIPKVDANGNLYYDGDEYLPDGTVNRRYGLVDMGTLTWSYNQAYGFYCSIPSYIKPTPNSDIANARCVKYVTTTAGNVASGNTNKSLAIGTNYVYVSDDAYTDAVTFKTAMSGVYLEYELATPTTETAEPYQETQIVDDFGTEEFVLADTTFPVPVGHETYYQNNLRAKLEMSPESPDGDGLYVVQQTSGQNEYVPLASTATIQDILTRLTALENA